MIFHLPMNRTRVSCLMSDSYKRFQSCTCEGSWDHFIDPLADRDFRVAGMLLMPDTYSASDFLYIEPGKHAAYGLQGLRSVQSEPGCLRKLQAHTMRQPQDAIWQLLLHRNDLNRRLHAKM